MQVPPEPPEQAGRSLYERLEISGMRSQLLRRSADLKKNVSGSQKYLDVLREMSAVVSTSASRKVEKPLQGHHNIEAAMVSMGNRVWRKHSFRECGNLCRVGQGARSENQCDAPFWLSLEGFP